MHRRYFCEDCPDKEEGCQSGCYNYELVPTTHKNRLDFLIDIFEKNTGTKLMVHQKRMLESMMEKEFKPVYVIPRRGYPPQVRALMYLTHLILFGGNKDEQKPKERNESSKTDNGSL